MSCFKLTIVLLTAKKIYKKFPYTIFFKYLPTSLVISVISQTCLTKRQINLLNYYFHNMIG